MTRMLLVYDVDGGPQTWGIPASVVENHWALAMFERGEYDDGGITSPTMLLASEWVIDDADLLYWAAQEMAWNDIKDHIVVIERHPLPQFMEGWYQYNMSIEEPNIKYRPDVKTAHYDSYE